MDSFVKPTYSIDISPFISVDTCTSSPFARWSFDLTEVPSGHGIHLLIAVCIDN